MPKQRQTRQGMWQLVNVVYEIFAGNAFQIPCSQVYFPFCKFVIFCILPFSLISPIFSSQGVGLEPHKHQKMEVPSLLVFFYYVCKFHKALLVL